MMKFISKNIERGDAETQRIFCSQRRKGAKFFLSELFPFVSKTPLRLCAFVFSLLLLLLTSCENDLAEVNQVVTQDELKYETMRNVELLYSDSAILRVKVNGDKMLRYLDMNNPTQEFPEGINVDFFGPNGRTQSQLSANYALRYEKKNEIIVQDSVVWESKRDDRLETEELIWDEKNNRVYTKKFVKNTRPEEIVYGYGFEADQEFKRWEINAITGRIKVEGLTDDLRE
jgi:LPS export ABC transporter protein LptC